MIDIVVDFLGSNNTVPVVAVLVAVSMAFTYVQSYYILQSRVTAIRESTAGLIEKAIDDEVLNIEEVSYVRASEIMSSRWNDVASCRHGEDAKTCDFIEKYYNYESDKFRAILHDSLVRTKESISTHIKINGFHTMQPAELEVYCSRVGAELYDYNKRVMRIKGIDSLDLIKNTHELRFTKDEAIGSYKRIVNNVVRIRAGETSNIANAKSKLKLNRKVISLFKGYVDG